MHGNVWEYCLDRASANYADSPSDRRANLSGSPDGERMLRGGSWSHNPAICRSAYRDFVAPDNPGWRSHRSQGGLLALSARPGADLRLESAGEACDDKHWGGEATESVALKREVAFAARCPLLLERRREKTYF
jgi:hypothetical protein